MSAKCMSLGVSKVLISGTVFNKKINNSSVDEAIKSKIISMYNHNSFCCINNENISNIHLFDEGLRLLESGLCILPNNFICRLNYFLRKHLHQTCISDQRYSYT